MECVGGNKRPTCYVHRAFRVARVKEILEHNTKLMKSLDQNQMFDVLCAEFERFEKAEARSRDPWYNYRLHWSGDLFSLAYARALRGAILQHPKTTFWCYTRSFHFMAPLVGIDNLRLYGSLDPVNKKAGLLAMCYMGPGCEQVRACYMGKENDETLETVPCPVDAGNMEIEGGCRKCGICVNGTKNVWFKVK